MLSDIKTCVSSICSIDSRGDCISQDRASKCNKPLWWIEPYNIGAGSLIHLERHQCFPELLSFVEILSPTPFNPATSSLYWECFFVWYFSHITLEEMRNRDWLDRRRTISRLHVNRQLSLNICSPVYILPCSCSSNISISFFGQNEVSGVRISSLICLLLFHWEGLLGEGNIGHKIYLLITFIY